MSNPYETPGSPAVESSLLHSSNRVRRRLFVAAIIAFVVTPCFCVFAWLQGYGPGAMSELQDGETIRGLIVGCMLYSPIHFLSFLLPSKRRTKTIGYAVSATTVALMSLYCFNVAKELASLSLSAT